MDKRGFLEGVGVNEYRVSPLPIIDGVVVPDGNELGEVTISSTGVQAVNVERTSGQVWDAIRFGPVNATHSTKFGDIDYDGNGYSVLGMHANAAVTFDLTELPKWEPEEETSDAPRTLQGGVAYFGQTPHEGASVSIWLDGRIVYRRPRFGREDGLGQIQVTLLVRRGS